MKLYTNIKTRLLTTNPLVLLSGSLAFFVLFLLIVVCIQQMILIDLNSQLTILPLAVDEILKESQNRQIELEDLKLYISQQRIVTIEDEQTLCFVSIIGYCFLLASIAWAMPDFRRY